MQQTPNVTQLRSIVEKSEVAKVILMHLAEEGRRNRQSRSIFNLQQELLERGHRIAIEDIIGFFHSLSPLGFGVVRGRGSKQAKFYPDFALRQIAMAGLGKIEAEDVSKFTPRHKYKDVPREHMVEIKGPATMRVDGGKIVIKRGDIEIIIPSGSDPEVISSIVRSL